MRAGSLAKSLGALMGIVAVASCAWSHGGRAGNARDISCMSAGECPWSGNPCVIPVCTGSRCSSDPAPEGFVPEGQIGGDCRESYCDGQGRVLERAKDDDPPLDDTDPCTEPVCSAMTVAHTPNEAGTPCGQDGLCNGKGACGVCMPGAKTCTGNAVASCDDAGQWAAATECTDATPICVSRSASGTAAEAPAGASLREGPASNAACVGIAEVAVGDAHACARLSDGTLRCWGDDSLGQLGDRAPPQPTPGLGAATQIAFGREHACARLADASVVCWGDNFSGQLGDGTGEARALPTPVPKLTGVTQISAGSLHTCARLGDGTVKCWGEDDQGQLGDFGSKKLKPALPAPIEGNPAGSPRPVPSLANVTSLALGYSRSCATSGGSLLCWGEPRPSLGTLLTAAAATASPPRHTAPPRPAPPPRAPPPHGKTAAPRTPPKPPSPPPPPKIAAKKAAGMPSPIEVKGLKDVADVHAGASHTCARMTDGTVECWGSNQFGQIGDGSKSDHAGPTKVKDLAGVVELAAGGDHTCARLADGSVRCWGRNADGELGDGSTTDKNTPGPVAGLSGAVQLSVGGARACARLAAGAVMCWGAGKATPTKIAW